MGVAKTSVVPDFCPTCQADTPSWVDMNKKSQMIAKCKVCNHLKVAGALRSSLVVPNARQLGGNEKEDGDRLLPVVEAKIADVLPIRKGQPAAEVRLNGAPQQGRRGWAPDADAFPAQMTAESIVERARAELARLDAEIPAIEADLAHAKSHRRGLARMVAAYDRTNPRPALPSPRAGLVANPRVEGERVPGVAAEAVFTSRRMTRREARERTGG
jgi:hypothetical protein